VAIRIEDVGEIAYGGLVTATKALDKRRMDEGKLSEKDIMKKFETYAYLVPGGAATIMSALGTMRGQQTWLEHISHGFMYGFPGFIMDVVSSMQEGTSSKSAAVREAQRIVSSTKQLAAGKTSRSYQPEFRKAVAW